MARANAQLVLLLVVLGAGWGITQPLAKLAVSTGYQPLGLIFWQFVIGAMVLVPIVRSRGKNLPFSRRSLRIYLIIALIGTILPNSASYTAIRYLPAGVVSVLLSTIPMLAFPIALALSLEPFRWRRLVGLTLGLVGVLILTLPQASLPDRAMLVFIPLAMIAPAFYAFEGNFVAKWGTAGLDAIQVLAGSSCVGLVLTFPLALFAGHWISPFTPFGIAEWALIGSSVIHAVVYTTYVWLVGRAGSVFATQVSYLVTGFGVLWAMVLLGERYSGWLWVALVFMFAGLFLVQPRRARQDNPA